MGCRRSRNLVNDRKDLRQIRLKLDVPESPGSQFLNRSIENGV
jgi:hypothetical protein